jgi:hypothetical protein
MVCVKNGGGDVEKQNRSLDMRFITSAMEAHQEENAPEEA